jgi:SH3-like domain-containing protein
LFDADRGDQAAMRALRSSGLVLAAALLAAPIVAHGAPQPRSTPSGLPVPRYVTLKFDPVNARAGPGDDHRLLWVFHARGLPVQVVAETDEWRRICDPDGGLSWVHKRTTDGRRAAMRVAPGPAAIRAHPNIGAGVQAYLAPRALAELDRCEKGWCKVKVGRISGWAAASDLWGAADAAQCR